MDEKDEVRHGDDPSGWMRAAILAEWAATVLQLIQVILGILR
jgi:hypothetical protein